MHLILTRGAFTDLVNLQLSGRVSVATTLNQLPSLQSLSVDWQTLKTVPQILDPQKLPGLRILGLITVDDEDDWENLQKTSILKLLPQLQALHLDVDLLQFSQGTSFSELAPQTLFDASVIRRLGPAQRCPSLDYSRPPSQHTISPQETWESRHSQRDLTIRQIKSAVETSPSSLNRPGPRSTACRIRR